MEFGGRMIVNALLESVRKILKKEKSAKEVKGICLKMRDWQLKTIASKSRNS